jgi:hypothetical protein
MLSLTRPQTDNGWVKEKDYRPPTKAESGSHPQNGGATAEVLMRLIGRIKREDGEEMIRIIDESCGRIDLDEW